MGQLRFVVPRRERLSADAVERAYFAGLDGIPWRSRNTPSADGFYLERAIGESGCLSVPWPVGNRGEVILSTANLMERERAYQLPLELARGTLNRLRNQLAAWQVLGFSTPPALAEQIHTATAHFTRAATEQSNSQTSADAAEASIAIAITAADALCQEFTGQALAFRHRTAPKLSTLYGVTLGHEQLSPRDAEALTSTFNTVALQLRWRDIELNAGEYQWEAYDRQLAWCRSQNLKVSAGPLLVFDQLSVPDWLYLWEDDFENVLSYARSFVAGAVQRYRGKVHVWHCAARLNVQTSLGLTEEQKLRLAVEVLETVRRLDPRTPAIVSFDQPWAEYLTHQALDLSPLHFADALVRAELGLTGIGLELNLGYWPGGSQPRDLLEVNQLLDRWGLLGLPLLTILSAPSALGENSRTTPAIRTQGTPSNETQRALVADLVPLLLSKPAVQGIFWNQWSDALPFDFPFSGLLDATGQPKPVLQTLKQLRQEHLM